MQSDRRYLTLTSDLHIHAWGRLTHTHAQPLSYNLKSPNVFSYTSQNLMKGNHKLRSTFPSAGSCRSQDKCLVNAKGIMQLFLVCLRNLSKLEIPVLFLLTVASIRGLNTMKNKEWNPSIEKGIHLNS